MPQRERTSGLQDEAVGTIAAVLAAHVMIQATHAYALLASGYEPASVNALVAITSTPSSVNNPR